MKLKTLSLAASFIISVPAVAEMNVEESLQQLKVNAENSESNYKAYQENADIAAKNEKQAAEAVKTLKKQRTQVLKTEVNIDANQKTLDGVKVQLGQLKAKEKAKFDKETQIAKELEAKLKKVQDNLKKREMNMEAYDKKMAEIDQEKKDWEFQRNNMTTLVGKIDQKAKQAAQEKVTWSKKSKSYGDQAKKWKKASKQARRQLAQFEKVQDQ